MRRLVKIILISLFVIFLWPIAIPYYLIRWITKSRGSKKKTAKAKIVERAAPTDKAESTERKAPQKKQAKRPIYLREVDFKSLREFADTTETVQDALNEWERQWVSRHERRRLNWYEWGVEAKLDLEIPRFGLLSNVPAGIDDIKELDGEILLSIDVTKKLYFHRDVPINRIPRLILKRQEFKGPEVEARVRSAIDKARQKELAIEKEEEAKYFDEALAESDQEIREMAAELGRSGAHFAKDLNLDLEIKGRNGAGKPWSYNFTLIILELEVLKTKQRFALWGREKDSPYFIKILGDQITQITRLDTGEIFDKIESQDWLQGLI